MVEIRCDDCNRWFNTPVRVLRCPECFEEYQIKKSLKKNKDEHEANKCGFHTCKKCGSEKRLVCVCHNWCVDCRYKGGH